MRQWNIDPVLLCRQHLLGEHKEMHMLAGCLVRGKSIAGYIRDGFLQVHTFLARHDELVAEMIRRGYRHIKPMPENITIKHLGEIDLEFNLRDLASRCEKCRENILGAGLLCPDFVRVEKKKG